MKRALDLLEELRDVVQGKPRLEIAEIAGGDPEGLPAWQWRAGSPARGAASR